jgi:DNA-directed RNA polymerase specialized sigma24 family protein
MRAEQFFADEWPALVPRLRAVLARAGASPYDRDDLVQETAARLLASWGAVDHERGIAPFATRIALNAWRDQWRQRGRHEVLAEPPELVEPMDTERVAIARLWVGEVAQAFSTLPASTVRTLRGAAAEAEDAPTGPVSAVVRMARSRARRALAVSLKVASAVAAIAAAALRGLSRQARTGVAITAVGVVFTIVTISGRQHLGPPVHWAPAPAAAGLQRPDQTPIAGSHRRSSPARQLVGVRQASATPPRPQPSDRAPYYFAPGPAKAGVFADLDLNGYGAQVSKPQNGDAKPVCLHGATPALPTISRCGAD